MMNLQKGDMYNWINTTWNPCKGQCQHMCEYCYYQNNPRFKSIIGKLRLDHKCFKDNLGEGNTIFIGSSTDLFAEDVPDRWINLILEYCKLFPKNKYVFQSKNPSRFSKFKFPGNSIFGTTIESNRNQCTTKAPKTIERKDAMLKLKQRKFVSIEPVLDFDKDVMIEWIKDISPEFVSIGADSKGHNLPEPSKKDLQDLIKGLKKITKVKLKDNLVRLLR